MNVIFKYCGGCNPIIDREKLAQEISQRISPLLKAEAKRVYVLINGCSAACGSLPAKQAGDEELVVSGALLAGKGGAEEELAEILSQKMKNPF